MFGCRKQLSGLVRGLGMGALAVGAWLAPAVAAEERVLFHEGFEGPKVFSTPAGWSRETSGTLEGSGAMHVQGEAAGRVQRSVATLAQPIPAGATVTLSGWIRTAGAGYRRDEAARIVLEGQGVNYPCRVFRRDAAYSYVESTIRLPKGMPKPRIFLEYTGMGGEGWFDEVTLTLGRPGTLPFTPAPAATAATEPWACDAGYRVSGTLDLNAEGEPVWADLDWARLLLLAGTREPIDPATVRVYAVDAKGEASPVPATLDNALANLRDLYDHNGTIKWRAVAGAVHYTIYFDAATAPLGAQPQADSPMLGVGDLLQYQGQTENLLWVGWPGTGVEAVDVDGDGDLDIYGRTVDAGYWLMRNIGTQAAPLFLPRAKPLASDLPPAVPPSTFDELDWDGDGRLDRFDVIKKPYGQGRYVDGASATVRFTLNRGQDGRTSAPLVDVQGAAIHLKNAAWHELRPADLDNDGRPDLAMGTTDGFLEALLNRGLDAQGRPQAERVCLPFNTYASWACEGGDMVFKPFPVDWNGDGHQDLVITAWQGFVWLALNKGVAGQFAFETPLLLMQRGGMLAQGDSPNPVAVDWDDDGRLDLLCGNESGHVMLFRNTGTPRQPNFAAGEFLRNDKGEPIYITTVGSGQEPVQGITETYWGYTSVAVADIDHDGDLDLIVNDSLGRLRWLENTGTRRAPVLGSAFREFDGDGKGPIRTPWRNSPGVVDWDGDGLLDLFVLDQQGRLVRYRQASKVQGARFLAPELQHDVAGQPVVLNAEGKTARGIEGRTHISIGDIDGDGDLDLLVGRGRNVLGGGNYLLAENVGTQQAPAFKVEPFRARGERFVEWTGSDGHDDWHEVLGCLVDWDGDGHCDLIGGTESGRLAYYRADYFKGERFALFTPVAFERRTPQGGERLLDYAAPASPRLASLATHAEHPLQYLTDDVRSREERAEDVTIELGKGPWDAPLHGALPLEARVGGVRTVKVVEFLLDDQLLARERTAPYIAFGDEAKWDTRRHANGPHRLKIEVTLVNGQKQSRTWSIRIAN